MFEFILAQAAQQATGIPAEVWVAIIAAISGSLIKPIFDLISQRITVQREASERTDADRSEERLRLEAKIKELELAVVEERKRADERLEAARDEEDVWREKYFAALERFNKAYAPEAVEKSVDLSDPTVLRDIIRHIAGES